VSNRSSTERLVSNPSLLAVQMVVFVMPGGMAVVAQGDQVLFRVVTRVAPELLVVNFEICHGAADLASPAVALQDGPMQF
jgi:hypothetical protein